MLQISCLKSVDIFVKIYKSSVRRLACLLGPVAGVLRGFDKCAIHSAYFYSSEAPLSKNISLWLSLPSTKAREVMELRTQPSHEIFSIADCSLQGLTVCMSLSYKTRVLSRLI